MTNLPEQLRAWAPLVSSGYEVPVAGQVMMDAARALEEAESVKEHFRKCLSYLKAYDFLGRDPGGYLYQMLVDGERLMK